MPSNYYFVFTFAMLQQRLKTYWYSIRTPKQNIVVFAPKLYFTNLLYELVDNRRWSPGVDSINRCEGIVGVWNSAWSEKVICCAWTCSNRYVV